MGQFSFTKKFRLLTFLVLQLSTSAFSTEIKLSCPRILVVVDGYFDSGSQIVVQGKHMGYRGASVLTPGIQRDGLKTFVPENYHVRVHRDGHVQLSLEDLIGQIQRLEVDGVTPIIEAVVPGTDKANPWTDFIAHRLGLPGNPVDTSLVRVDKAASNAALRDADLPIADYLLTADPDEALAWANDFWNVHHRTSPIVVRPPRTNGGDGTAICYSLTEVSEAVDAVLGNMNQLGQMNEAVVLSRYVAGPQYAVDTVSYLEKGGDGDVLSKRVITGIWHQVRDPKSGFPTNVYDHNILLPQQGEVQELLLSVNARALGALQQRVGGSHFETILSDEGAVIIDPNCRIAGGELAVYEGLATGRNVIRMAIDAHAGRPAPDLGPYELKTNFVVVYLRSHGRGARLSHRMHPRLELLKTAGLVHDYKFNYDENELLLPSIDSESMVGKVVLKGPDLNALLAIKDELRDAEFRRLFEQ